MDIGDKVRVIKGNLLGKIGIIQFCQPMKGPVNVTENPSGLEKVPYKKHFIIKTKDGTSFPASEDQLELAK